MNKLLIYSTNKGFGCHLVDEDNRSVASFTVEHARRESSAYDVFILAGRLDAVVQLETVTADDIQLVREAHYRYHGTRKGAEKLC